MAGRRLVAARSTRHSLHLLISAGPTREPLDPVRFISNYSTGYMGAVLAEEALARGHRVVAVSGPSTEPMPPGARVISVERSGEMERALRQHAARADVVIMAAAVSDFRPVRSARTKLIRSHRVTVTLRATPDIVARLPRRPGQLVAGFALETAHPLARAREKLGAKDLDLMLAQQMNGRSPFGRKAVHAWLLTREGPVQVLGRCSKRRIACLLLDKIEALWYGQRMSQPQRRLRDASKG